jgi:hypothetical protein
VAGQRVGRLQVELSGEQIEPALEYLRGRGLGVEVQA